MVRELSVQEQKYQAVMAVLGDGRAVSEVAALFGMQEASDVAEYMMYRWADDDRARAEDLAAGPA
jgi:hypothetical protein